MGIAEGWTVPAKDCDTCKSATAAIFCRVDEAFLCFGCDAWIHRTDTESPVQHERVWLCEVCKQAPASITCRADAATLCLSCDVDIHSANILARRHERVPVEPFFDASEAIVRSASLGILLPNEKVEVCRATCGQDELEAVSCLPPNLNHGDGEVAHMGMAPPAVVDNLGLFLNEMESLLDLESENGGMDWFHSAAMDSLVPAHTKPIPSLSDPSLTNTASLFASHPTQSQICGTDREARVLRYREKRKNRKFEKTIRYASRKAYAECRPRFKGRFAKRSETETEIDIDIDIESDISHYFFSLASPAYAADTPYAYGVVPMF